MESANSKINKFKMRHALRSRYAPSLGSGSTSKIFPRNIFSAQDDSEGRLRMFSEYIILQDGSFQTLEAPTKYV